MKNILNYQRRSVVHLISKVAVFILVTAFLLPVSSMAASNPSYSGGSGTASDPYHIASASDLMAISTTTQAHLYYILENDIDLSAYTNWTPISDAGNGFFLGHFDGNNHIIKNFTVNDASGGLSEIGLFGDIGSNATLSNLTLTNVNIQSISKHCEIGSLSPFLGSKVTNCSASGTISGIGSVGGLFASTDDGTIMTNCSFVGSVSVTDVSGMTEVGGLVAHHDGIMTNCFTHGSVSATGLSNGVGGLAGDSEGGKTDGIISCYSDASVSGSNGPSYVGGLVGDDYPEPISNCYFAGSVAISGDQGGGTGGLVGRLSGGGTMTNCYEAGPVSTSGVANHIGVLAGRNENAITACYWDQDINRNIGADGLKSSDATLDASGVSTSGMQQQSTFNGWDFSQTWSVNSGSFPYLKGVSGPGPQGGGILVTMVLHNGLPLLTINGITTILDATPEIKNSHLCLPIRAIVEALGGTINYNAQDKSIQISSGTTNIVLTIGGVTAQINGQTVNLDTPAYISNNRTMVPLRFITENLGCKVNWDSATQQVTILH